MEKGEDAVMFIFCCSPRSVKMLVRKKTMLYRSTKPKENNFNVCCTALFQKKSVDASTHTISHLWSGVAEHDWVSERRDTFKNKIKKRTK